MDGELRSPIAAAKIAVSQISPDYKPQYETIDINPASWQKISIAKSPAYVTYFAVVEQTQGRYGYHCMKVNDLVYSGKKKTINASDVEKYSHNRILSNEEFNCILRDNGITV